MNPFGDKTRLTLTNSRADFFYKQRKKQNLKGSSFTFRLILLLFTHKLKRVALLAGRKRTATEHRVEHIGRL